MLTFSEITAAAERLRGVAHRTPILTSRAVNAMFGCEVLMKAENLQRMGAFKFRGGYNAIAALSAAQRAAGVVAFSSGNHAQAVALSAQLLGCKAVIVMPQDAPKLKIDATKGYGAEVVLYDRYTQDRAAIAQQIQTERGGTLIPPYDYLPVMAGQGTCGLEIALDAGRVDSVIICTSGGGLLSGCAIAIKQLLPQCEIFGAEPEAGNDMQQSLRIGEIQTIAVPDTICDGLQTQAVGFEPFKVIKQHVKDILTAKDETVIAMMRLVFERMKMVVEPSGAAALAALYENRERFQGQRVAITFSGGNIDFARFAKLLNS
ncbi:MAG: pyridoxal-phosphate dependent enzyme [Betaproteobacteria bacterium]|nr:MAG: pyridoxal-phosphate dependent enzyme [Betaproteobacteria bacterium]TAG48691.1 MAG: pyridoxal-phosphate dependent enzyme [Betaproteobacteria bacterium]